MKIDLKRIVIFEKEFNEENEEIPLLATVTRKEWEYLKERSYKQDNVSLDKEKRIYVDKEN